ncbi:hypothetical protein BCV69DRAFT_297542 [Microstroma glucosiphilum]|uniref:Uncharacterized protein n=1 Tax=Pseudomicrostroma glucosiphilum TaxID=1684307 RepID=A0A316UAQ5_9BASI|nr:hypothetical protein BCV69DRAFT_297542 [Pseudomicrostroma glucosiphilum]PWN22242.1 hypothetical protein BCV69DRAFT_297542 [Pseudomicrostroma glucosiphilum]
MVSSSTQQQQQQQALHDIHLQFASLKLPGHCPPGVYVQQDEQDPLTLHGVLFPPSEGIYRGGVFRFLIAWTGSVLPSGSTGEGGGGGKSKGSKAKGLITSFPRVTFQEGVGHPLISSDTRLLSLSPRFPTWRPRTDTLPHLLYYIRDVFSAQALEEIATKETWWTDKEIGRLLQTRPATFEKLAAQSVTLSSSRAVLHSSPPAGGKEPWSRGIGFPEMGEEELEAVRRDIFG